MREGYCVRAAIMNTGYIRYDQGDCKFWFSSPDMAYEIEIAFGMDDYINETWEVVEPE